MDDQTSQNFGSIASQAMTDAAASLEPSMKESSTSIGSQEIAHKRHFLQTFRRWEMLFKRKDGNVESDKWLIAEYYKSLGHLSEAGLDRLTEMLKDKHTFFPTIKECLDLTRCGPYDYGHPFYALQLGKPSELIRIAAPTRRQALAAPVGQIGEGWGGD